MTTQKPLTHQFQYTEPGTRTASALRRSSRALLPGAGMAMLLLVSTAAQAQLLGTAANFGLLGATPGITNTGLSLISGSVGVWPSASITGFPPGQILPGTGVFHSGDAVALQAQSDTTAAYITLAGLVSSPIAAALGGQTRTAGVYNAGAADLSGTLTLNGPGLYVFQTSSLTTAAGPGAAIVNLIGGASPCDVWWQVSSSAAIGTYGVIKGNILALTSITIDTGASLEGRALARNGTVTLAGNAVTACSGGTTSGFLVPSLPPVPLATVSNANVPTLSELSMMMLGVLLAVVGFAALRQYGHARQ